jgi:hypothetical protein
VPPVEGYHESVTDRDSNMGWDALGARTLWCWPLVCPSLAIPDSKCPEVTVEPGCGPASEPLDRKWAVGAYIAPYAVLTYRDPWPISGGECAQALRRLEWVDNGGHGA